MVVAAIGLVAGGLGILGTASAAIPNAQGVIYGCYTHTDGSLRVINYPKKSCLTGETQLSWNKQGQPGQSGTSGLAGVTCPTGQEVVGFDADSLPVCQTPISGGPTDSDADGLDDPIDPCPAIPNVTFDGQSYCPGMTYEVNAGLYGVGSAVALTNVAVTAKSGTTVTVSVLATDPGYQGTTGASLDISMSGLGSQPALTDRITVYGNVTTENGLTPVDYVVTGTG